MTLIAAFVSPTFAVMVADRRRTQLAEGTRVDDVRKIHKLSENAAVGFAGIYHYDGMGKFQGAAERIINLAKEPANENSTLKEIADDYAQTIQNLIGLGVKKEMLEVSFHFIGLDDNGRFALGRVSHLESFEPVITAPPEKGITWAVSRAEYSPTEWIAARVAALKAITPTAVQQLAVELVEHTAERDGYVSEIYDMLTLTR